MATVASFNTANPGNASSITVTKPSGLAVGDLMIFHYGYNDGVDTADTISGWTHEVNSYGGSNKTGIQYKIADSGDVAASNFTVSFTGIVGNPLAGLLRITDYVSSGLLNENKDTGANSDNTLSMAVTPSYPNSLILMFIHSSEGGAISNYAIATDNPSWSEQYDIQNGSSSGLACASATRTQTTSTGDSSFTSSSGSGTEDYFGILVAIETPASVTVSPTVVDITTSVQSPTVSGGATVSPTVVSATTSVVAPTVSFPQDDWTNQSKSSADTWTNQSKS